MAQLLASPRIQFLDSSGNPLNGGLVYTYVSGTSTPLATYTSQAGGTENANPVVLDSAGRANIWLGSGAYRIVVQTSAGVEVFSVDGVRGIGDLLSTDLVDTSSSTLGDALVGYRQTGTGATGLTGSSARTVHAKLSDGPLSVKDFGAVGGALASNADGTAVDDTTAIRNAIAAAQNDYYPREVYIPAGHYIISDTLLPDPGTGGDIETVRIRGEGAATRLINRIPRVVMTGTIDVTVDSATVSGTGTAFDASWIGRTLEIGNLGDEPTPGRNVFYSVVAVASATSLTLNERYRGATATGLAFYWHKAMFAIVDPTQAMTKLNGSYLKDFWIANGDNGSAGGSDSVGVAYRSNKYRSNGIELTSFANIKIKDLILSPFGHGICHRRQAIFQYVEGCQFWPESMPTFSGDMTQFDGVRFEGSGAKDNTIYRDCYTAGCRIGYSTDDNALGSSNNQIVFDNCTVQALTAPRASATGTATAISNTATANGGALLVATLTDSTKAWLVDEFKDMLATITGPTLAVGRGQVRRVIGNTATVLMLYPRFDTANIPNTTSTYQVSGGGFAFLGGAIGVNIREPYFENVPGSGGNIWAQVNIYLGEGSSNNRIEGCNNAGGAIILASDSATNDTWLNSIIGGQSNRIRIDTAVIRTTLEHVRIGVSGDAASGIDDNGTNTTRINCAQASVTNIAGNQRWGWEWDTFTTATDLDATPSVRNLKFIRLSNSVATNVTFLDDGVAGQLVVLYGGNGNSTLVHAASTFRLLSGANIVLGADNVIFMIAIASTMWVQIGGQAS